MEKIPINYVPLPEPVPITEQVWPEGTRPLVCTRTMAYMQEKFIRQCLEGILIQRTTFPVQVVIHDDASTDATPDIIREYETKYPQLIKVVYQKENSHSKPDKIQRRAEVMRLSQEGRYSAICEGDDYWTDPLKLQKQVAILESDPSVSGVFHFTEQRFEGMQGTGHLFGSHEGKLRFTVEDTISELALFHFAAFIYRSSAFSVPYWFSKVPSGDMALFSIVAGSGDLVCIPEIMSVYRKHPGGITTNAINKGTSYHWHRILLWLFMDRHFKYRYTAKCQELFLHHWQQILWGSTPIQRLQYLRKLLRAIPGWFLHHPAFSMARLRECLRG